MFNTERPLEVRFQSLHRLLAFSGPRLHSRPEGVLPLRKPGESNYSPAVEPCPEDSLVSASGNGPPPTPYPQLTATACSDSLLKIEGEMYPALQITLSGIPPTPRAWNPCQTVGLTSS